MRKCEACDGSGAVETESLMQGRSVKILAQCRRCNDIASYSRRVQMSMGFDPGKEKVTVAAVGNVLAFPAGGRKGRRA